MVSDYRNRLPKYVVEPIEKQSLDKLKLIRAFVDELIEDRERPIEVAVDEDEELIEQDDSGSSGTTVIKKVPCGKECEGCPHGPYEYTVTRQGDSLKWDYVGKAE